MFDWVLNAPPNATTIFFPDVSKLKLMTFSIVFSTINFSYQYLPQAKAYLEPSRTFYNRVFYAKYFFCKIHKETPVLQSHFNKVADLYSATLLKEGTPKQMFFGEVCEMRKVPLLQNTSRRLLLFYRKNILSIK